MRVVLHPDRLEVRLALWEKVLGLMRDLSVPREEISGARVEPRGVRAAAGTGLKVGLRLPGVYYVARSITLDRAYIVRRGVPALEFSIRGERTLRHVLVSAPDAEQIAARLAGG